MVVRLHKSPARALSGVLTSSSSSSSSSSYSKKSDSVAVGNEFLFSSKFNAESDDCMRHSRSMLISEESLMRITGISRKKARRLLRVCRKVIRGMEKLKSDFLESTDSEQNPFDWEMLVLSCFSLLFTLVVNQSQQLRNVPVGVLIQCIPILIPYYSGDNSSFLSGSGFFGSSSNTDANATTGTESSNPNDPNNNPNDPNNPQSYPPLTPQQHHFLLQNLPLSDRASKLQKTLSNLITLQGSFGFYQLFAANDGLIGSLGITMSAMGMHAVQPRGIAWLPTYTLIAFMGGSIGGLNLLESGMTKGRMQNPLNIWNYLRFFGRLIPGALGGPGGSSVIKDVWTMSRFLSNSIMVLTPILAYGGVYYSYEYLKELRYMAARVAVGNPEPGSLLGPEPDIRMDTNQQNANILDPFSAAVNSSQTNNESGNNSFDTALTTLNPDGTTTNVTAAENQQTNQIPSGTPGAGRQQQQTRYIPFTGMSHTLSGAGSGSDEERAAGQNFINAAAGLKTSTNNVNGDPNSMGGQMQELQRVIMQMQQAHTGITAGTRPTVTTVNQVEPENLTNLSMKNNNNSSGTEITTSASENEAMNPSSSSAAVSGEEKTSDETKNVGQTTVTTTT